VGFSTFGLRSRFAGSVIGAWLLLAAPALAATDPLTTLPPDVRDYYMKVDAIAKVQGWACVYVGGPHAYAYTVGLSGHHVPELLLFVTSFSEQRMCHVINDVARHLLAAGRPPRTHEEPLGPNLVRLNWVYPQEFFEKCEFAAIWRDVHGFKGALGMQIVFQDPNGTYP